MTAQRAALVLAVVLTGLSAGVFYTYEVSVTQGLHQVDDVSYVTTFQALNGTIRNPGFGLVFFGAIPAIATALALHWKTGLLRRSLIATGLALYLGCLAITAGGNVPLNDELAEVASVTPASAAHARGNFEADWNRLNLIRTVAVVASFAAMATAAGISTSGDEPRRRQRGRPSARYVVAASRSVGAGSVESDI